MKKILTVCLNPVLQKTIVLEDLQEDEVNRSSNHFLDIAGKGVNVSRVLHQLGEEVIHLTQAGGRNQDILFAKLKEDGVAVTTVESGAEIRFCYTLLNRRKSTTTEIVEEGQKVSEGCEKAVWERFTRLLPQSSVLIISGSKAAGFSNEIFPGMVRAAKSEGLMVVLDVRKDDLVNSIEYRPDVIMPNFSEFLHTFFTQQKLSETVDDNDLLENAKHKMQELYSGYGIISVLTRGGKPTLFMNGEAVESLEPPKLEPVNTIGCGDAFTAGFTREFMKGSSVRRAVEAGQQYAVINARHLRPGVIR